MSRPGCGPLTGGGPGIGFAPPPRELAAIGSTGFGQFDENPLTVFTAILPVIPTFTPIFDLRFQLGDSHLFTQNAGALKYIGPAARIFQIVGQVTAIMVDDNVAPVGLVVALFRNGSITHSYAFSVETINSLQGESASVTDTLLLQPGDELSLRIAGSTLDTLGRTVGIFSVQLTAQ